MGNTSSIKLKVCGMKDPESIREIVDLNPDYMGLIFYPKSKRYVVDLLSPEVVREIPSTTKKVGVFVNEELEKVLEYGERYGLDFIQLHGNESPEYCKVCQKHYSIIKAFPISEEFDFNVLEHYKDVVDYFLFDTKTKKYGGSGKKFNWDLLKKYSLDVPYFLSGGIGEEDVERVLEADIPPFYCLDINSKVEIEPGKKDFNKVKLVKEKLEKYRSVNSI